MYNKASDTASGAVYADFLDLKNIFIICLL